MIPIADPAALFETELVCGVMSRRVVAWLLDLLIIGVVLAGIWLLCFVFSVVTLGLGRSIFVLLPIIPIAYHWLFVASSMAATPGQALLGLTVRRNEDLGLPSGIDALVFTLLFYVTMALGAFWTLVALFTVRHRTFHDILSGLVVVRHRFLVERAWNPAPRNGFAT